VNPTRVGGECAELGERALRRECLSNAVGDTLSRDGMRIVLETDDPDGDDEFNDVKTHAIMDVATKANVGLAASDPGFQTFTHDHKKMIASTFKSAKNARFDVYDGDTSAFI